jgi:hypothetical protein
MSKSNAFENDVLRLIFSNVDIAGIGDAGGLRGSAAAGSLFLSLHATWPPETGDQTSGEVSYTGYGRRTVARGAGFTVTGNSVSPAADQDFGQRTDAGAAVVARFWAVGSAVSGAGKLMYRGVIGAAARLFTGTADDNIRSPAHGLAVNDEVVFFPVLGLALPAGITEGTVYFVRTVPDVDNVTLSATAGGAVLDLTGSGVGVLHRVSGISIALNSIPRLSAATSITEE